MLRKQTKHKRELLIGNCYLMEAKISKFRSDGNCFDLKINGDWIAAKALQWCQGRCSCVWQHAAKRLQTEPCIRIISQRLTSLLPLNQNQSSLLPQRSTFQVQTWLAIKLFAKLPSRSEFSFVQRFFLHNHTSSVLAAANNGLKTSLWPIMMIFHQVFQASYN